MKKNLEKETLRIALGCVDKIHGHAVVFQYLSHFWEISIQKNGEFRLREVDDFLDNRTRFDPVIMKEITPDAVMEHINNFVMKAVFDV